MKLDRVENTKRNIVVGEADKVLGILLPFLVRTLMIHLMGAEYLGLTGLFYSIVQMLNLAEMGFGTAIIYSLYDPIAKSDAKRINALLLFYEKVYRVVGCVICGAGLCLMPFLPLFMKGTEPEDVNVYVVYGIFLVNSFLNCMIFPNRRAFFSAMQREDLTGKIHIVVSVLMYGLQIVSILLAKDYYLYVLTIPFLTVTYAILCSHEFKKQYPDYREEGSLPEELRADIKKQVLGLTVRRLATYSRNAFDSIFVSAYLGLTVNAVYGNYYYVMDAIVMIVAVVKTSMAGGVGNSIALETQEKNVEDMHRINFLFMIISGWCATCLLCLYQPFMKLWVGEDMTLPFSMAVTFSVYFYILKMSDIRSLYAESVGIWWQGRYLSVAEAVANLTLNWLFIKFFGLFGIVLATMISYTVFNFIGGAVLLYKYYFTKQSLYVYFKKHILYMAVSALVAGVTLAATWLIPLEGIGGFLIKAAVCAVLPGICYVLIYFKTGEYRQAKPLIKVILKLGN